MTATNTLPRAQVPPRDTGWTVVRENLAALIGFVLMVSSVVTFALAIVGIISLSLAMGVLITTLVYVNALRP